MRRDVSHCYVEPVWVLIAGRGPQKFMPDEIFIQGMEARLGGVALNIARALTVHRGQQVGSCTRRTSALSYCHKGQSVLHTGEYEVRLRLCVSVALKHAIMSRGLTNSAWLLGACKP